ncbi:MAG: hypothetical protein AAFW46_13350 [Pseudomonadota bacterium]
MALLSALGLVALPVLGLFAAGLAAIRILRRKGRLSGLARAIALAPGAVGALSVAGLFYGVFTALEWAGVMGLAALLAAAVLSRAALARNGAPGDPSAFD